MSGQLMQADAAVLDALIRCNRLWDERKYWRAFWLTGRVIRAYKPLEARFRAGERLYVGPLDCYSGLPDLHSELQRSGLA